MNQADANDLLFIPTAINEINRLLHEAAVAEKEGDSKREQGALKRAGAEAVVALEGLRDHPVWDELRHERQLQLQQWQDLGLPVVDKLLVELGYKPPPPARSLIEVGNTKLRSAVGLPESQAADPITLAQQAISDLVELIGKLMKSLRNWTKLKEGLRWVCKALTGVLVAAIVIPAVQAGFREVSPEVAVLLRELLDGAAHILPSVSMAYVASVAFPDDAVRQLIDAGDAQDLVEPREIDAARARGESDLDRLREPGDGIMQDPSGFSPEEEMGPYVDTPMDESSPQDIAVTSVSISGPYERDAGPSVDTDRMHELIDRLREEVDPEHWDAINELDRLAEQAADARQQRSNQLGRQAPEDLGRL